MTTILINYGHYLGLAALFAALSVKLVLFRPRVDGRVARQLALADAFYGLAAVLSLATGLLKVFAGDKPAAYYGHNPLFHIKVTLFAVALLLSLYPTIRFIKQRRAAAGATVAFPGAIGTLLRVEMLLLVCIPLLAVMMARGYGFGG